MRRTRRCILAVGIGILGVQAKADEFAVFRNPTGQTCTLVSEERVSALAITVFDPRLPDPAREEYGGGIAKVVVPAGGRIHLRNETGVHVYTYVWKAHHQGEDSPCYTLTCHPLGDVHKWEVRNPMTSGHLLPESGKAEVFTYRIGREAEPLLQQAPGAGAGALAYEHKQAASAAGAQDPT